MSFIVWLFWNWFISSLGSITDKIFFTLQIFSHISKIKYFENNWTYPFFIMYFMVLFIIMFKYLSMFLLKSIEDNRQ